jgi:hypothetical protein
VGMSGIWRCLGKHRVAWDLASPSPVQVGLLPDHEAVELHVMDLEAGKSSQRRPCVWSWLRPPFDLADIPIRARGVRRIRIMPIMIHPFWRVSRALILYAGAGWSLRPSVILAGSNLLGYAGAGWSLRPSKNV